MKFFRYLILIASAFSSFVTSFVQHAHYSQRYFLGGIIGYISGLKSNMHRSVNTGSSMKLAVQLCYDTGRTVQHTWMLRDPGEKMVT